MYLYVKTPQEYDANDYDDAQWVKNFKNIHFPKTKNAFFDKKYKEHNFAISKMVKKCIIWTEKNTAF